MLNGPFSPWPSFSDEEAALVANVLSSNRVNYWTGEEGRLFEKEFAEFAETTHAIALANGTLALDLALHGLGIGERNGGSKSDEVIVTPRSFIASASSVVNAGAVPVFVDVDLRSGNISSAEVERHLTASTKAVLCVHLAGWPCDIDELRKITRPQNIAIIEDCAQAHGAKYKGRSVGGLGDVAAWSFCQDKIMTTGGEGGMVTTNDHDLWYRMWSFKDHGKDWDTINAPWANEGFRWVHNSIGSNFRITEMQAALGRHQLRLMDQWHNSRAKNAQKISNVLRKFGGANGPIRLEELKPDEGEHAYYKYYFYVVPSRLRDGWNRDRIIKEVVSRGVPCFQGSCSEIYHELAFKNLSHVAGSRLENAKSLGDTSVMLLVHPSLTEAEIDRTNSVLEDVLGAAINSD